MRTQEQIDADTAADYAKCCENFGRHQWETKDRPADILIHHAGRRDTMTISANARGRELVDHYLQRTSTMPGAPEMKPGRGVMPPWATDSKIDKFGFHVRVEARCAT